MEAPAKCSGKRKKDYDLIGFIPVYTLLKMEKHKKSNFALPQLDPYYPEYRSRQPASLAL